MSKNNLLNRRKFLGRSVKGAAGAAAGLAASNLISPIGSKTEGSVKDAPNSIKVALYSVTFSGVWYDGPSLSVGEVIRIAKAIGYDGVELGAKRPHASPVDVDKQDCLEIRRIAEREGIELCAAASYNNFTNPIVEQRENELLMLKEQMRVNQSVLSNLFYRITHIIICLRSQ